MIKSIIHAGGESTRLRDIFNGPKPLAPVDGYPLLWFHLQPLVKSGLIKEYVFTLRHEHEIVEDYIKRLENKFNISTHSLIEPKPLGRAGVVKLGIENGIIDTDSYYLSSHPDDLIPININKLIDYTSDAERRGKTLIIVMAKHAVNPFGIGITRRTGDIIELRSFVEKPELPLLDNHFANTGMMLFLPEAMKEFKNVPLDQITHPEYEIVPKLVKQNKVAVFLVNRWISVNYSSDYKNILKLGSDKLLEFLNV